MPRTQCLCLLALVAILIQLLNASTNVSAQGPIEPGPEHEVLKQLVGSWTTEIEMMVPGQDAPLTSEGTEETTSICSGLFTHSVYSGNVGGIPFEGFSVLGYDTSKEKYTGTWIDNFGTSLYSMEGTYDAEAKQLKITMTGPDPTTGEEFAQYQVTTFVDENTKKFEAFMTDPSGQSDQLIKVMTMISKRND